MSNNQKRPFRERVHIANQDEQQPKQRFGSIGLRSQEKTNETYVDMFVVGQEKATSTEYKWDGLERKDANHFIFQYTLSGFGEIRIGQEVFTVNVGQAFMVEVPGDHCYYLPPTSQEWEFIFLTLQGEAAATCWRNITRRFGHVLTIPMSSDLIGIVQHMYEQAYKEQIRDPYEASIHAYTFVMECYRFFQQFGEDRHVPDHVNCAVHFIQTHYHQTISVDGIAAVAHTSKYHLIKQFRESMHMTPGQFVTKTRLEKAFDLLHQTNLPIKEIATQVGYANDNYFNKAFRKVVGISPGKFRQDRHKVPFNRLLIQ